MSWLYRKNIPKNIVVHHTGVSYDKNPDQFEATNTYHKSKGWGMIGYHHEIAKDGTIHKGREHHQPGAHCYQKRMNYESIGIVLDGNFDIEMPTAAQIKSLKWLLIKISNDYKIHHSKIGPHRNYATYKSCYGSKLADDWASKLVTENDPIPSSLEYKVEYEGRFLLDASNGKLYVIKNDKKIFIPPNTKLTMFVKANKLYLKVPQKILDKL